MQTLQHNPVAQETAPSTPLRSYIHPLSNAQMVFIPAAKFEMGCATGATAEQPAHEVTLSAFWVDENPVTNAVFARFVSATGYRTEAEIAGHAWGSQNGEFSMMPGLCWSSYATVERADHPVVLTSWNDAQAYCQWARLRLLTEAEWERCARGGADGHDFPWGNDEPDGSQSNFARPPADLPPTNPVGLLGVNPLGLADLVGNVWQWCSDFYSENYYSESPSNNPQGPVTGNVRVRRGGSWNVIQGFRLRCSNRGAAKAVTIAPNMGFRCAKSY